MEERWDTGLRQILDQLGKVLKEKGPFTPEEDKLFWERGRGGLEQSGLSTEEIMEGTFRSIAAQLPERERFPLRVWSATMGAIRKRDLEKIREAAEK